MLFVRRFLLLALFGPFLATAAHAITLDWDTVTWTAGSLSNSYNIDPLKAGNDITVSMPIGGRRNGSTRIVNGRTAGSLPAARTLTVPR